MEWNDNYGFFSKQYYEYEWNGKEMFLNYPETVTQKAVRSLASALWIYMTPRGHLPSPHEIVVKTWLPENPEETNAHSNYFGTVLSILHPEECG